MKQTIRVALGFWRSFRRAWMLACLLAGAAAPAKAQSPAYAVNSIADLKGVSKTSYTRVRVAGYGNPGDGGGGLYVYDSSDSTSADNGGTIIVATDLGRWKLSQGTPPTIRQFGATAVTGAGPYADSGGAIQAALNACSVVVVPPGAYACYESITINSGNALIGSGGHGQVLNSSRPGSDGTAGAARLFFYNSGATQDACLTSSASSNLLYSSLKHIGIYVDPSANYNWIIHFTEPVGLEIDDLIAQSTGANIGGIKCNVRFSGAGPSLSNHFYEIGINLPGCTQTCMTSGTDGNGCPDCTAFYPDYLPGNQPTLDVDFTDSEFLSGHLTGGQGVILRGAGAVSFANVRFDHSFTYNVTILHDVVNSVNGDSFLNCLFEQCLLGQVLVNLDAQDGDTPNATPRFVGNVFWTPQPDIASYNKYFPAVTVQNASGPVQTKGGIFTGNYFFANWSPTIFSMPNGGLGWTIAHNKYLLNPASLLPVFTALTAAKIVEDNWIGVPMQNVDGGVQVLGQAAFLSATDPITSGFYLTGSTAETVLASIPVPAGTLGSAGKLRISATFNVSNSASGKTARIRFGSALAGTEVYTANVSGSSQTLIHVLCEIAMRDTATGEITAQGQTSWGPGKTTGTLVSGSVDTTAAQSIVLTGQLSSGSDAITLEQYTVELIQP